MAWRNSWSLCQLIFTLQLCPTAKSALHIGDIRPVDTEPPSERTCFNILSYLNPSTRELPLVPGRHSTPVTLSRPLGSRS
ncbi:hypothetical protein B0H67DRAFT_590283 [Lasiosphaeris hirsuta]|uniref:Secreted protein n=1 Tax=Lasiosphaeris hirsuta TaxID=260670 RepID=A0AA40A361_9PEZI|nr:hypothetical protein B0H67DRAFT_590283 [Lasiosphaeris hirsuta]